MERSYRSRRRSSSTERKYRRDKNESTDRNGHSYKERYIKRSRSRSPRKYNDSQRRYRSKDDYSKSSMHDAHQKENSKHAYNREEEFFDKRRQERELLGIQDCPHIWNRSPLHEELVFLCYYKWNL